MTRFVLTVVAGACTLVSCTRTVVQSAPIATPVKRAPEKPRTAVAEMMRRQVKNAVDAGEGDARVRMLRQQVSSRPADLQPRLQLAAFYVDAGFPEIALEHYRTAANQHPDNGEVAVLVGKTLAALGLPADARAHLQSFASTHPAASWDVLSWLAILQDGARDYAAAERNHRAALELRPNSDALHNNLGYNLLLQGNSAAAAVEFRKALEIAPGSALARSNLAIALATQPSDALNQWQTVTDAASAHSNLAAVLIEQGDYKSARRQLELALGYRKDHAAALNNRQLLAELDGEPGLTPAAARSTLQKFVRNLGIVLFGGPATPEKNRSTATRAATGN